MRLAGGLEVRNGLIQHACMVCVLIEEAFCEEKGSQLHIRLPAQGSSSRKRNLHNFRLLKPEGMRLREIGH